MANPPPPYSDITGISRTVMKDNAQETLANYNGNARPGEIVADLTTDPPALYIGNNAGQLTALGVGGGYGNTQVAQYLTAGLVGNIIPAGNATYSLGNATNWWSNVWLAGNTIYLGGVPLAVSGNTLTVNGDPVAGLPLANGASNISIPAASGNVQINPDGSSFIFTGNNVFTVATTDLDITAPDDIAIYGGDKLTASEGGDVNIDGGQGGADIEGEGAGTGGDVTIDGGLGGTALDTSAGSGGFVRLRGGEGGAADIGNLIVAGEGGEVRLFGGRGGDSFGNVDLAVPGGNIDIRGGEGTPDYANNVMLGAPGHVNIRGGNWDWPGSESGNIYLFTGDFTNFNTWGFLNNGNLVLPPNGQIVIDSGDGFIGPSGDEMIISWDNEELVIRAVSDNINLQSSSSVVIETGGNIGNATGRWDFSADNGRLNSLPVNPAGSYWNAGFLQFVGNSAGDGSGSTTLRLIPDDTLESNDQYIIIDPTGGGDIHIRPGGAIDASSGRLVLGGENSAFVVEAGNNPALKIFSDENEWAFYGNALLLAPGEVSTTGNVLAFTTVTSPTALANLAPVAGARAFVSDGNLTAAGNFGAQIGSGGSNTVPVWSDGVNWYIG